jgi:hypothetical protein
MNSNLDKFFRGVGEGYLQSAAREMRHRDVVFAGPEKRNVREKILQREKINKGAKTVTIIVSIWIAIFLGIAIISIVSR